MGAGGGTSDTPGAVSVARRRIGRALAAALPCCLATPSPTVAQTDRELEYGRYLARECAGCHRLGESYNGGNYSGVPSITGFAPDVLLERMATKRRAASAILRDTIATLDADQLNLIARYLATLPAE
jgi:mono/diheme cytochrome c family protein